MAPHKFKIGQTVEFDAPTAQRLRASGPFEVTRVLPADDVRSVTYRIRSKAEPFERSVMEYQLVAVA